MPIVAPEQLEKLKEDANTIKEVLGGYKGPYLPHVYDNRQEALRENIKEAERLRLKAKGLNMHAQTPEQVKAFEARKKETTALKQRAALAGEMANQNK